MGKNKRIAGRFAITLILLLLILWLGPMDGFSHGFFANEIDCEQIAEQDYLDQTVLAAGDYEMTFSPQKAHFAGFELYLKNQPKGNQGTIVLTVLDGSGKELDIAAVDLSKVKEASWYQVYTKAKLKKHGEYVLRISAGDCVTVPCLQNIAKDYLLDETVTGNILISYLYAESTFTVQNKVIIFMFLSAVYLLCMGFFVEEKTKKYLQMTAGAVFMTSILTWNYMYHSMDQQNGSFAGFQEDSETLVTGVIEADRDGNYFIEEKGQGFGLGRFYDLKGELSSYGLCYLSDDNWLDGYSRTEGAVIVATNGYSREVAEAGNYISFANGETFQITAVEEQEANTVIFLDSKNVLTPAKYGSLDDTIFYDDNHQELAGSMVVPYKSQYGLQGKVWKRLARWMNEKQAIANLNLICCFAAALVFVGIVALIWKKYNGILAGCFYVTFLLSPWIVNFARNLYWVEFTWFLPMAVGLFCAWKIDSRMCRIVSYFLALLTITAKCLCGYEYTSTVMMGLISFLLADLVAAWARKDKKKTILLLRTVVIIGSAALAGFLLAICIHALLRGEGNLIDGIKIIIQRDVLRRTMGANLNEFAQKYWDSFNASVWEVFCKYFHFSTEIITGIAGNLFPLLCIVPLCILGYEYRARRLNIELAAMYVVFFLTAVSWFCLAKSHSYIHLHLNFVLWYFGFVQICFYIILNQLVTIFRGRDLKKKEGAGCR